MTTTAELIDVFASKRRACCTCWASSYASRRRTITRCAGEVEAQTARHRARLLVTRCAIAQFVSRFRVRCVANQPTRAPTGKTTTDVHGATSALLPTHANPRAYLDAGAARQRRACDGARVELRREAQPSAPADW